MIPGGKEALRELALSHAGESLDELSLHIGFARDRGKSIRAIVGNLTDVARYSIPSNISTSLSGSDNIYTPSVNYMSSG